MSARGLKNTTISLGPESIKIYATSKVLTALSEVTQDMSLYKGVRLGEVLKAVYDQVSKTVAKRS